MSPATIDGDVEDHGVRLAIGWIDGKVQIQIRDAVEDIIVTLCPRAALNLSQALEMAAARAERAVAKPLHS